MFNDSYIIWEVGRSPEKWHVNNTMALCQVQLNLSLKISHSLDHKSLECSEMLSNELIFLACRWTGIMCPQILVLMALLWSSSLAQCGACLQIMHWARHPARTHMSVPEPDVAHDPRGA